MGKQGRGLRMLSFGWLAAVACLAAVSAMGVPASRQIVVRELLNQTNGIEWVGFPFAAEKGECVAGSVRVVGPRGPVAAQLSAIEIWPSPDNGFVRSARLHFLVEGLLPLSSNVYEVSWGKEAAAPVSADLRIQNDKGILEITTSQVGIRLPLGGETYARPTPVQAVPGPLAAMRLGDRAWAGGSSLTGTGNVTRWAAELVDAGPVFARARATYVLEDSNVVTVSASVAAGDNTVRWEMDVREDRPDMGVEFRLPPVPGVTEAVLPKRYGQWGRDRKKVLAPSDTPFGSLSPDTSIVNAHIDNPSHIRLVAPNGVELQLRSHDAGAWVDPVPMTYGGYPTWTLDSVGRYMSDTWRYKAMPVRYANDGTVTVSASFAKGGRKWSIGSGDPMVGEDFDRTKDLVLEWPVTTRHPHLYFSPGEQRNDQPEFKATAQMLSSVRRRLELLGNFDVFREAIDVASLYDAVIDSDLVSPAERVLLRAQMAYLGYVIADPMCWSMERGYLSGNPNMSVAYTLSQGIVACLLPEHPKAREWADYSRRWMDKWLTDEVGANGEWLSEGDSYGGFVSYPTLLAYTLAAKRAGHHDFSSDPRLKKLALYFAKQYMPPDPRRGGKRLSPPVGRAHGWQTSGTLGLAARLIAGSDPEASRILQWLWAQGEYPMTMGESRLGPFIPQVLDKSLPMEAPQWQSELFPALGPVLRHGFGTPSEHYVNLLSHVDSRRNLDIWTPCVGGINTWFAHGKPVSVSFDFGGGYAERHELLRDGVLLAHTYDGAGQGKLPFGHYTRTDPEGFAALPAADYVRAAYAITEPDMRDWFPANLPATPKVTPATGTNLTWTRQALLVKDSNPAGPTWLLLRDTAVGGQPTQWQFWSLSEKIGTPEQAREAGFLGDAPGKTNVAARELPTGSRYTAIGQFGVDMEFFVASPTQTPRATFRFGGKSLHIEEYQDLLQLRLPGDGVYYVAILPRPRTEAAPTMTALADGRLVKVTGAFGADYAFLSTTAGEATAEGVSVKGTAAVVQTRPGVVVLSLGAAGEVRHGEFGLAAAHSVALRVEKDGLQVDLMPAEQAQAVTVMAAGAWTAAGATITEMKDGVMTLSVPAGVASVRLKKK